MRTGSIAHLSRIAVRCNISGTASCWCRMQADRRCSRSEEDSRVCAADPALRASSKRYNRRTRLTRRTCGQLGYFGTRQRAKQAPRSTSSMRPTRSGRHHQRSSGSRSTTRIPTCSRRQGWRRTSRGGSQSRERRRFPRRALRGLDLDGSARRRAGWRRAWSKPVCSRWDRSKSWSSGHSRRSCGAGPGTVMST